MSVKAVRYYESLGLVRPARLPNGYRDYAAMDVRLVRMIRLLAESGIRVQATRPFVDCVVSGNERGDECAAPRSIYREAISSLDDRIAVLSQQRDAIANLLDEALARDELPAVGVR